MSDSEFLAVSRDRAGAGCRARCSKGIFHVFDSTLSCVRHPLRPWRARKDSKLLNNIYYLTLADECAKVVLRSFSLALTFDL